MGLKVRETLDKLSYEIDPDFVLQFKCREIEKYLEYADKHIDLIYRRVILGEEIPHSEKMFSVFEPHTRWINKGKMGVPVEFGLPVSVLKDQFNFVLDYELMETTNDVDVAVPLTKRAKEKFPSLKSCSYDKGYWSPKNWEELNKILDSVILPKKGRLSLVDKEYQSAEEFKNTAGATQPWNHRLTVWNTVDLTNAQIMELTDLSDE